VLGNTRVHEFLLLYLDRNKVVNIGEFIKSITEKRKELLNPVLDVLSRMMPNGEIEYNDKLKQHITLTNKGKQLINKIPNRSL
jgi:hypothetical protein